MITVANGACAAPPAPLQELPGHVGAIASSRPPPAALQQGRAGHTGAPGVLLGLRPTEGTAGVRHVTLPC